MKNNSPSARENQTSFTMRIDSDLLEKIKIMAIKNKRSTAKQVEFMLEHYIDGLSEE